MDNRYQFQSFWVKRWRDLWLLMIPYWAVRSWIREQDREYPNVYGIDPLSFKVCWFIACGTSDLKRKWIYTGDELEARQAKRDKVSYKITFNKSSDDLVWVIVKSNPDWVGVGSNKAEALCSLRESVDYSGGVFNLKTWWLSKRIKFSKTGKL